MRQNEKVIINHKNMDPRFTLEIKPLKGNTSAEFTVWDNKTGKRHQKEVVQFASPEAIKLEKKVWENLVDELNK